MQFIAQDLSQEELNKGTGCSLKNAKANDFTPQDWTGNCYTSFLHSETNIIMNCNDNNNDLPCTLI
jgi:hypothetical protein